MGTRYHSKAVWFRTHSCARRGFSCFLPLVEHLWFSSQDRRGIRLVLIGGRSRHLDMNQHRHQVVFMHDCRSRVPIPPCGQAWGGSLTHARCTQCRIRSGDIEGGKGETYPRRRSVARCVSRGASALRGGTACVRTKVQAAQKVTQDRRARRRQEV